MFGGSHSAKLQGFLPNQYYWALDVLPVPLSCVFIWVSTTGTILGGMEIIKLASSMQHLYHFEQEKKKCRPSFTCSIFICKSAPRTQALFVCFLAQASSGGVTFYRNQDVYIGSMTNDPMQSENMNPYNTF